MYLIKNPINNLDSIHSLIKQISLKRMNKEFIGNEKKYKYYNDDSTKVWLSYDFDFYNYTDNWIGSNTAHFIENKEDDGGPTSMYFLSEIQNEKIAEFSVNYCKNDTTDYYATMNYYRNDYKYKTDTMINNCPKLKNVIIPRIKSTIYDTQSKARVADHPTEQSKK